MINREVIKSWLRNRFGENEMDGALDDLVSDLASQIGSGINNDGVDRQIEFVIEQCGDSTLKVLETEFAPNPPRRGDD